jgi:hypothetical protein
VADFRLDALENIHKCPAGNIEQIGPAILAQAPDVTGSIFPDQVNSTVIHGTAVTGIGLVISETIAVKEAEPISGANPNQAVSCL